MSTIKSIGAYIPFHSLKLEVLAKAWGGGSQIGEKSVANFDEDTITMAVEASRDCLKGIDKGSIDRLYFASSSTPYNEKQSASIVAAALGLKKDILTIDFTNTIRAGTNALQVAIDTVRSGSAKNILVTASDCRLGAPGSDNERIFGDGAAALLVSNDGVISLEGSYNHTDEIIDQWRTRDQPYVQNWEDRFVKTEGYQANVKQAITSFLKKNKSTAKDFNKVVIYAPDQRSHLGMCRTFKFDPKTQVQDPMFSTIGNTGVASCLMTFVAALENAVTDDRILLVNYGDGCDILSFKVNNKLEFDDNYKGIKGNLGSKVYISSYEQYIQMRKIMEMEGGRSRPPMVSSAVGVYRDRKMIYQLTASKCTSCGRAFYPPQRICLYCQAIDEYEDLMISDKKGKVFTYCKDQLADTIDPPLIVCVVNLENNMRVFGQMTDRDPDRIEADMEVDFTFRWIGGAGGFHNYFWKFRPLR